MKITSLHIRKLHKHYDYDVEFNKDVTFLYGTNGCGKTTILNITEALISGHLYKLFEYDFDEIILFYSNDISSDNSLFIRIKKINREMIAEYKGESYSINLDEYTRFFEMRDRYKEIYDEFSSNYRFVDDIRKTFNYVYLPLNRNVNRGFDEYRYSYHRRFQRLDPIERAKAFVTGNYVMDQVEDMINAKYQQAQAQVSRYNDRFRNEILTSLLETNIQNYSNESIFALLRNPMTVSDVKNTQEKYIKLLMGLGLIREGDLNKYTGFFEDYCNKLAVIGDEAKGIPLDMVFRLQELDRIKTLIPIAEETEEKKSKAMKPFKLFLDIMNEFVGSVDSYKEFKITQTGKVYITTKNTNERVSISNLSSGEQQLLIFFAYLVFGVNQEKAGIFVVDEPELSLHLSWQKRFVDKALSVNSNLQLIFATHSPEIIGKYRDKMFHLEKKLHE